MTTLTAEGSTNCKRYICQNTLDGMSVPYLFGISGTCSHASFYYPRRHASTTGRQCARVPALLVTVNCGFFLYAILPPLYPSYYQHHFLFEISGVAPSKIRHRTSIAAEKLMTSCFRLPNNRPVCQRTFVKCVTCFQN